MACWAGWQPAADWQSAGAIANRPQPTTLLRIAASRKQEHQGFAQRAVLCLGRLCSLVCWWRP